MGDSIRPTVESTVGHVEGVARTLNANSPRVETIIKHVEGVTREGEGYLVDNRENIKRTLASLHEFSSSMNPIMARDLPKIEKLLDGFETSRARADRVLYQADQIAGQASSMLARSRAEVERSITNVRDSTDWANKLVQKIFQNPFVLSPFYKPNHEDLRVQGVYDSVLAFTKAASELSDAAKTIQAVQARAATPQQQEELAQLQREFRNLTNNLNELSTRLAEGLKRPVAAGGERRIR
jgi:phospholipid/cholesterol/gamma-HCH transport system substrate-binding protein